MSEIASSRITNLLVSVIYTGRPCERCNVYSKKCVLKLLKLSTSTLAFLSDWLAEFLLIYPMHAMPAAFAASPLLRQRYTGFSPGFPLQKLSLNYLLFHCF